MKKILYVSGILTVLLLVLLLTGWADKDDAVKEALRQGNELYELTNYRDALISYETGLADSSENKALNFSAAQAAYIIGEYEKAIGYYEKSGDSISKFLNAGNICYRVGDAVEETEQKAQYYAQALQIYMEGIIKYPENVPLKYNYERAKEKLEAAAQDMEQENSDEGESGDEQENGEQGESGDEQESQEQDSEDSEASEDESSSEEQEQDQQQDGEEQQGDYSSGEEETVTDQEAIERILQMLENQEEESLKNNQEVVGGNEGKNGW